MKKQKTPYDKIKEELDKIITPVPYRKNSKISEKEHFENEWNRILDLETPEFLVEVNKFFGNKYIPLQRTEMLLRGIFGHYQTRIPFPLTYAEGVITFVVELSVTHPATGKIMKSTGVSAVPMTPAFGKVTDVHYHVPAAKSFAIMNAASHLGRIFRAQADDYNDVFNTYFDIKPEIESPEDSTKKNMKDRLLKMIDKSTSIVSLRKKEAEVKKIKDTEVTEAYNKKHHNLLMEEV